MVTTLHVGLKAKYLKKGQEKIIELPFAPNIAIIKQEKSYTAVYSHNILIKKELYIHETQTYLLYRSDSSKMSADTY